MVVRRGAITRATCLRFGVLCHLPGSIQISVLRPHQVCSIRQDGHGVNPTLEIGIAFFFKWDWD